jgi:hypothetical protein
MKLKLTSNLHCVKINADDPCWRIINTKPCGPCCFVKHSTEKTTRTSFHNLKPITKQSRNRPNHPRNQYPFDFGVEHGAVCRPK